MKTDDKRPDPKPRKMRHLWQAYLNWHELVEMRKRHNLRISSIEAGKSNMDAQTERDFLSVMQLDLIIEGGKFSDGTRFIGANKQMIFWGEDEAGPIWEWVTSIKGLASGSLAAQLLAQIDNIGKFATISKLWRFAGYAVIDGHREHGTQGEKSHVNKLLSAICWNIADEFVKQQTPIYVDIYYEEKSRLKELHPEPIPAPKGSLWKENFTDSHIHRMAMRKAVKIFLANLWLKWREFEGLPVSAPYAAAILGHTNIIYPA